ncbi:unnamed protein product, partial [Mesorhabditis spiculigera]
MDGAVSELEPAKGLRVHFVPTRKYQSVKAGSKGGYTAVFGNVEYMHDKAYVQANGEERWYWRCIRKFCKARLVTSTEGVILSCRNEHTHCEMAKKQPEPINVPAQPQNHFANNPAMMMMMGDHPDLFQQHFMPHFPNSMPPFDQFDVKPEINRLAFPVGHQVQPQQAGPSGHSPSTSYDMPLADMLLNYCDAAKQQPANGQQKYGLTDRLLGSIKDIQGTIASAIKYEPPEEEEGGTLKLSSLATNADDEDDAEMKSLEREQRLSLLNQMQMDKVELKKKQLEKAFKSDCETFKIVTLKLLGKDADLEKPLRIALMEVMTDLEKQLLEKLDAFIATV